MTTQKQDVNFGLEFLEPIVEWISTNLEPQDIFDDKQLGDWAKANDYKKDEE